MSELPAGPLPTDLEPTMLKIMHDVGLSSLTKNTLRKRLEAKYNIEFASHSAEVDAVVSKLMTTPEIQLELAKIQQEKETLDARASKKRGASPSKKAAKQPKKENTRVAKEKKPEDYPKAALSAYMIYAGENRDKIKEKNPDMKLTEVLSEVGRSWNALSEDEKATFQKRAEVEKERFKNDMEAYVANGGKVFKRGAKKGSKTEKKAKDPNAPKRPLSAYMYFAADFRTKNSGLVAKEMMSAAGVAWNAASAEAKKPFEELAAKDRQRYELERANHGGAKASKKQAASDSASSSSSDSDSDESD